MVFKDKLSILTLHPSYVYVTINFSFENMINGINIFQRSAIFYHTNSYYTFKSVSR